MIRISGIVKDSIVDGPGIRNTIFVQGCPHRCKGCHNPQTWSYDDGKLMSVNNILSQIQWEDPLYDGITISGGEPLEQMDELFPLLKRFKERGIHIIVYTGFKWEEFYIGNEINEEYIEFLENIDILIDGPYVEACRSLALKFRGSSNQRVIDVKKSIETNEVVTIEF